MESSIKLASLVGYLETFAPLKLAEDWDNVGLLIGDRSSMVSKVMTCLTITPDVVQEAITDSVGVIISHHPMPFQSLKKINSDSITGQMILNLIQNRIAVFSPHTAFDSTSRGINQMLAARLGLVDIHPLQGIPEFSDDTFSPAEGIYGVGRMGLLTADTTCREFCQSLKKQFDLPLIKFCGDLDRNVTKVGIACGSAGQFLSDAGRLGCDAFVTGETNFHTCLESLAKGVSLFLLGHYGSERFAVESLANELSEQFPKLPIIVSKADTDPIQYII